MPAPSGGLAVLKNRDFSLYLAARFLSNIATQMLIVAVGWQVYHITGSVLDLGLIGLSQFLPFLCLVLLSGHIADQYDRRIILLCGLGAYFVCSLLLLTFSLEKIATTLPIFGVLALYGITRAFQLPAAQSFVPTIVEPQALRNALALNSSANQVASIAGPSVGGVLYALAEVHMGRNSGAGLVYGASATMLLTAAVLILMIAKRRAASRVRNCRGTRCCRASASCGSENRYWVPFRWICLPYCSGVPRRCCRPIRATCCTPGRPFSAICGRRPASARG